MATNELEVLRNEVNSRRRTHYQAQKLWSMIHNASTFGAAALSLIIASLSQMNQDVAVLGYARDSISSCLALIAAALTGIAARGGFERKWRANRLTRSSLDQLKLDLIADNADVGKVRDRLKDIIKQHDVAIIGGNGQTL